MKHPFLSVFSLKRLFAKTGKNPASIRLMGSHHQKVRAVTVSFL